MNSIKEWRDAAEMSQQRSEGRRAGKRSMNKEYAIILSGLLFFWGGVALVVLALTGNL